MAKKHDKQKKKDERPDADSLDTSSRKRRKPYKRQKSGSRNYMDESYYDPYE